MYICRFGAGGKLAELIQSIASKFQTDEMLTEVIYCTADIKLKLSGSHLTHESKLYTFSEY